MQQEGESVLVSAQPPGDCLPNVWRTSRNRHCGHDRYFSIASSADCAVGVPDASEETWPRLGVFIMATAGVFVVVQTAPVEDAPADPAFIIVSSHNFMECSLRTRNK